MITSTVMVRALETRDELEWMCRLSTQTFRSWTEDEAGIVLQRTTESPEYRSGQWRGAFIDDRPVGGYIMHEREMRAGTARLPAACIGSVVTDPAHRMSGVGRALMLDAIAYARQRNHALLLLNGIPDFYHRFGYVDVLDLTEHHLAHAAVAALAPSPYRTRPVHETDAAAVLSLHERQYGQYTGSFERDLAAQQHRLRDDLGPWPMVLALDEHDTPRGYLEAHRGEVYRATEVTADNWAAASALVHAHARLAADAGETTANLRWPLPPDSPILTDLIDNLALPSTSRRERVTTLSSVESRTYHHPNAGWLARPAQIGVLLDALLPVWRERWTASSRPWHGKLTLEVAGDSRTLVLDGELRVHHLYGEMAVRLTPASLVQLVFGYRDAKHVAKRAGNRISKEMVPVLQVLFPPGHAWIPGTDEF